MTAIYLGKLAAADVFTFDNAFTLFEFAVHEDGGVLGPFGIHSRRDPLQQLAGPNHVREVTRPQGER